MTFSFAVPVWELLITVAVTAVVTAVTIRWSVRASSRETTRTLRAAARAEVRARRDRDAEIQAEVSRADRRERSALVGTLMALASEMEEVQNLPIQNDKRLSVIAKWNASRALFEGSHLRDAYRLYSFANLRILTAFDDRLRAKSALAFISSAFFLDEVRDAAMDWANTGALDAQFIAQHDALVAADVAEREATMAELFRRFEMLDAELGE